MTDRQPLYPGAPAGLQDRPNPYLQRWLREERRRHGQLRRHHGPGDSGTMRAAGTIAWLEKELVRRGAGTGRSR